MAHVLETGFEILNRENPNGSPTVMGYNIINGEMRSASDGETFESRNPAWFDDCVGVFPLSTKEDVHDALISAREASLNGHKRLLRLGARLLETWGGC